MAEDLLDNDFRADGVLQVEVVVEDDGRIDVVVCPAPIRMLLAVPTADAERSAGVSPLVPPHVLAEDIPRHRP